MDDADELPGGWAWATIADVTESVPNIKPEDEPTREFAYVDISSIDNQTNRIISTKSVRGEEAPSRARRPISVGDVLFSNVRTYLRNIAIVPDDIEADVCSTGFTVLRPCPAIEPRYLFRYTLSDAFIRLTEETQTGTHYPATSDRAVMALPIPVAPLAEQRRIVPALERILERVNAARERLNRVPITLKRFRQAVLAAACSGRLTPDWRNDNPDTEPADTLIGRLLAGVPRRTVERGNLPDIPEDWTWLYLPDTGEMNRGKSRHRPRNAAHLYGGPYPFIQTGDIANSGGRITTHKQTYSEAGLAQSRLWSAGTICITIAANIADSAILTYPACFPDSVVGVVTTPGLCDPEYLEFFLRTAREDLAAFAPATAQANINIAILNDLAVPLPPFAEQQEIVRRANALFSLADAIEEKLTAARRRVEGLTQAVLAKAFRGELVPTEAELARREGRDYEPASALLERIRAEREQNGQPKRARRRQV